MHVSRKCRAEAKRLLSRVEEVRDGMALLQDAAGPRPGLETGQRLDELLEASTLLQGKLGDVLRSCERLWVLSFGAVGLNSPAGGGAEAGAGVAAAAALAAQLGRDFARQTEEALGRMSGPVPEAWAEVQAWAGALVSDLLPFSSTGELLLEKLRPGLAGRLRTELAEPVQQALCLSILERSRLQAKLCLSVAQVSFEAFKAAAEHGGAGAAS